MARENAVTKFLRGWASSLFPHAKAVRYVLIGFVVLAMLAWATQCRAADLTAEVGAQYLRGPAAAMLVTVGYPGPKDTSVEAGLLLVGAVDRDDRASGDGVMGAQVLLVDGFGKLDLGLGLAYMNRVHQNLGSELNFSLMVRYRFTERWSVAIRHWSNAGTTDNNRGLDVVTVGYRF